MTPNEQSEIRKKACVLPQLGGKNLYIVEGELLYYNGEMPETWLPPELVDRATINALVASDTPDKAIQFILDHHQFFTHRRSIDVHEDAVEFLFTRPVLG